MGEVVALKDPLCRTRLFNDFVCATRFLDTAVDNYWVLEVMCEGLPSEQKRLVFCLGVCSQGRWGSDSEWWSGISEV
jgi:hypothetical protein